MVSDWLAALQLPAQESRSQIYPSFLIFLRFVLVTFTLTQTVYQTRAHYCRSLCPWLRPDQHCRLRVQLVEGTIATLLLLPYKEMRSLYFR